MSSQDARRRQSYGDARGVVERAAAQVMTIHVRADHDPAVASAGQIQDAGAGHRISQFFALDTQMHACAGLCTQCLSTFVSDVGCWNACAIARPSRRSGQGAGARQGIGYQERGGALRYRHVVLAAAVYVALGKRIFMANQHDLAAHGVARALKIFLAAGSQVQHGAFQPCGIRRCRAQEGDTFQIDRLVAQQGQTARETAPAIVRHRHPPHVGTDLPQACQCPFHGGFILPGAGQASAKTANGLKIVHQGRVVSGRLLPGCHLCLRRRAARRATHTTFVIRK
ncbi:hypothetical protein D3C87_1329580 [compost metagenome]